MNKIIELNERLSKLSLRDRILIIEVVQGISDCSSLSDELANIYADVITYTLPEFLYLLEELNPRTWHIPQTKLLA